MVFICICDGKKHLFVIFQKQHWTLTSFLETWKTITQHNIRSIFVQLDSKKVLACQLIGTNKSPKPMVNHCQPIPLEQIKWHFNQNITSFLHEEEFENVIGKIAPIFLGIDMLKSFEVFEYHSDHSVINMFSTRKDFNNLRHFKVEKW